jgi:putative hydrolase of the HAD superfamily
MAKFNVVLFDLGATLLYFDADWETTMMEAVHLMFERLLDLGYLLDSSTFPAYYRSTSREYYRWRDDNLKETPVSQVFRKILTDCGYPNIPDEHVHQALADLYSVTEAHWQIEADALATLTELRSLGYHIGLISNAGYDEDVQILIDKAGLRPYLEFIITSAASGIRKPHPHIFQLALDHFGVRPEQAVMVGDFLEADVKGANELGIHSVWITRRVDIANAQKHLPTLQPERIISTLSELPQVLEQWES